MDLSPNQFPEARRKDGWSPALKARFLTILAEAGNVRLSTRRCGLSAQSAYVQRRRDPLFARGWDAALELALPVCEEVLADRAIEGIEEEVWYRGELVGMRRRYDSRLLLAHLARLDARPDTEQARDDAERFDEIVALIAGAEFPECLLGDTDLPRSREDHVGRAVAEAEEEAWEALPRDVAGEERDEAVFAAIDAAQAEAEAQFDGWMDQACTVVDGLQDSVNLSTSDMVDPPRDGEGAPAQPVTEGATSPPGVQPRGGPPPPPAAVPLPVPGRIWPLPAPASSPPSPPARTV